jgi:hypothetical protein
MKALVFVISGLLLAAPAVAQTSGELMSGGGAGSGAEQTEVAEEASAAATEEAGERRICRKVETASGSRMSFRRLCMTADQWRNFNRRR